MNKEATISSDTKRYLQFSLGSELYAIPLLRVREVIATPQTTPIPNSPAYFTGIMNLRGQVISIIDLRKKLNIKTEAGGEEEAVIILDLDPIFVGVTVDSVNTVLNLDSLNIQTDFEAEGKINIDYISGITRNEKEELTVLMHIEKLFDFKELKKAHAA